MKKIIFSLTWLILALSACAAPNAAHSLPTPVEEITPVPRAAVTEASVEGKIPAPSFESQTYIDEVTGFALEYPAGWTVQETMTGERGSQVMLLSAPAVADLETLPPGATRVAINVNQWDPKSDLAAFVESRKAAWEASGFTIVEEEALMLDLGLPAIRLSVQTPDGDPIEFLFAAVRDQYVTISGEGDLELVKEIMRYLRPIQSP